MIKLTDEADVGHEAAVVVIMRAAGDSVRRHLAVHVEVSESRPTATTQHKYINETASTASEKIQFGHIWKVVTGILRCL